jgi:NAD(P)-dependent dehydrogenase (short-subunit alcohol dehydrogenase family)
MIIVLPPRPTADRIADVDGPAAGLAADEVNRELPGRVSAAQLDVRDGRAVRDLVHTVDRERCLDLLVNNAGIGVGGPAEELTEAHWTRQLDVNLIPSPGLLLYATSKHAMVGSTLALRGEAAPYGVKVSVDRSRRLHPPPA